MVDIVMMSTVLAQTLTRISVSVSSLIITSCCVVLSTRCIISPFYKVYYLPFLLSNSLVSVLDSDLVPMLDFLDSGARVNEQDDQGETALHHAARWRRADEAKLLCDRGADPNAKDKTGLWSCQLLNVLNCSGCHL